MAEVFGVVAGAVGVAAAFSACVDCYEIIDRARHISEDSDMITSHLCAAGMQLMRWGKSVDIWHDPELMKYKNATQDDKKGAKKILNTIENQFDAASKILRKYDVLEEPRNGFRFNTGGKSSSDFLQTNYKPKKALSPFRKVRWSTSHRERLSKLVESIQILIENLQSLFPAYQEAVAETDTDADNDSPQAKLDAIQPLLQDILQGREEWRRESAQALVEIWLDVVDFNKQYDVRDQLHKQTSRHLEGTCHWIFQRPEYLKWIANDFSNEAPTSRFLWIKGSQGSGKTILCSNVIRTFYADRRSLAYFFSTDHARAGGDLDSIVRSWIAQLAQSNSGIRELVLQARRGDNAGTRASIREVWSLFRSLLMQNREITLVIDGFDEYVRKEEQNSPLNSSTKFLQDLKEYSRDSATRFLVVSRDEYSIKAELSPSIKQDSEQTLLEYRLTEDDVAEDVKVYANSVIDRKLPSQPADLRKNLAYTAAERCAGTFQWISCLEWDLEDYWKPKQLEKRVMTLPSGLKEIYLEDLAKIKNKPAEKRDRAFAIFRWVTLARRPLTAWELAQALLVKSDGKNLHLLLDELPAAIKDEFIRDHITNICGSMIIVESRKADDSSSPGLRTVHPAHPSISDFLLSELPAGDHLSSADHPATQAEQHGYLATVCFAFLNDDDVWNHTGDAAVPAEAPPFLDYATQYWHSHMSNAKPNDVHAFEMLNNFLKSSNPHFCRWAKSFESSQPQGSNDASIGTPLYYATIFGLVSAMERILKEDAPQLNAIGGLFGTPLQAACATNQQQPFHMLLKAGADPNVDAGKFGVAIIAAASEGSTELVTTLLNSGAKVESKDSMGRTAIYTAAKAGHTSVVEILLDRGADANAEMKNKYTPVNVAADEGHEDIVRLLVDHRVDLSIPTKDGWTPLTNAADGGHSNIVQLLLEHGADGTTPDLQGRTPIWWAAKSGHAPVVELLLHRGKADIHSPNNSKWTTMATAAANGHLKVVELLLARGADPNIRTKADNLPVYLAARSGHTAVTERLLNEGVEVDVRNERGWTLLQRAADGNHVDVIRLLLKRGAIVNLVEDQGGSAIYWASRQGHEETVQILVEAGADVNIALKTEWTPLNVAALGGKLEVVKILLDHGANLNLVNSTGLRPLHNAAKEGRLETVKLLLDRGADPTSPSRNGWLPLYYAVEKGYFDVVKLLLDRGAEVNTPSNEWTPLYKACGEGFLQVAQLLLERGADPNALGKSWTPLYKASEEGRLQIVQLLLDRGVDPKVASVGWLPLDVASRKGHLEVVRLLLDKGSDIAAPSHNWTPLYRAIFENQFKIAEYLIDHGADLNQTSIDGWTPLIIAVKKDHFDLCELLLDRGACPNRPSTSGWTPLYRAVIDGHMKIVKLLLDKGANVDGPSIDGWRPLIMASKHGYFEICKLLLERGADPNASAALGSNGWTPLYRAVMDNQIKIVELLLENGANVNGHSIDGWRPLIMAAKQGFFDICQLLLNREADPNAATTASKDGWNPLYRASLEGHSKIVRLLLDRGADPEKTSIDGWTPLLIASSKGHSEVVRLLLERKLNVNARNRSGKSALAVAAQAGWTPIVERLVAQNKIEIDGRCGRGRTPLFWAAESGHVDILKLLLDKQVDLNAQDSYKATALSFAARHGKVAAVETLLSDPRVEFQSKDVFGRSALVWASLKGKSDVVRALVEKYAEAHISTRNMELPDARPSNKIDKSGMSCDVCSLKIADADLSYHCSTCDGGDFDVCPDCFENGISCYDKSHKLTKKKMKDGKWVEADD